VSDGALKAVLQQAKDRSEFLKVKIHKLENNTN
jgi:hypothetical protein